MWPGTGEFAYPVVGLSHYDGRLSVLAANPMGDFAHVMYIASLVPEADNPHDVNAIAVVVRGKKIGHLSADIAPLYRAALNRHGLGLSVVNCQCAITGGLRTAERHYSYVLELDIDMGSTPVRAVREPAPVRFFGLGQAKEVARGQWEAVFWLPRDARDAFGAGTATNAWTKPEWSEVNFYIANQRNIGLGIKIFSVGKPRDGEESVLAADVVIQRLWGRWCRATIDANSDASDTGKTTESGRIREDERARSAAKLRAPFRPKKLTGEAACLVPLDLDVRLDDQVRLLVETADAYARTDCALRFLIDRTGDGFTYTYRTNGERWARAALSGYSVSGRVSRLDPPPPSSAFRLLHLNVQLVRS